MRVPKTLAHQMAQPRTSSFGEGLTGRPTSEDVDTIVAYDLRDVFHDRALAQVPIDTHSGHMVVVGFEGFSIVVCSEDHAHSCLFKAKAESSSAAEEIGSEDDAGILTAQA